MRTRHTDQKLNTNKYIECYSAQNSMTYVTNIRPVELHKHYTGYRHSNNVSNIYLNIMYKTAFKF